MQPRELLDQLLEMGRIVRRAREAAPDLPWDVFLGSAAFGAVRADVSSVAARIVDDDWRETMDALDEAERRLLAGRSPDALATGDLIRCTQIRTLKQRLAAGRAKAAAQPDFLRWLSDEALPVLERAVPIALALLL